MESFEQQILFRVECLSWFSASGMGQGVKIKNILEFFCYFLLLIFLNGINQFKQQVLSRKDFLSVTSDYTVQCPRVGLEVKCRTHLPGIYMPLRALFLVLYHSLFFTGIYSNNQHLSSAVRSHYETT